MNNQNVKAYQIAAVYVGTIVGAGFATGREIVEFFSRFGFLGLLGIFVSGYLFTILGTKIMMVSVRINARNYMEFNDWLFGKRIAIVVNILFCLMLFGVTAVMMSGAGELFQEQMGFSKMGGMLLTCFLAVVVMTWGIKGLLSVNTFVVPAMVGFNIILMSMTVWHTTDFGKLVTITYQPDGWKSIVSPLAYAAFNLALALAVMVPLAVNVQDQKVIKKGASLGGMLLTIILLCSYISLSYLPNQYEYNIPTAEVMKQVAPFLYGMYLFIIYGEIFTSIIGNAFGLERQLKKATDLPSWSLYCLLLFSSFLVGQIEYGPLLSFLYPLFGYISMLFLGLLIIKNPK